MHEEEYTTALPAFSLQSTKDPKERERKERGLRGVLPFQRKKRDKDRDRDKEKDRDKYKSKEKEKEKEKGMLDLLEKERRGEYNMGSMRGRPEKDKKREERDEEF